jgi:hypothetical protein
MPFKTIRHPLARSFDWPAAVGEGPAVFAHDHRRRNWPHGHPEEQGCLDQSVKNFVLNGKLECTVFAYAKYLYQMVCPTGLAIPYPRVKVLSLWEIIPSICMLSAFSFMAYRQRKRHLCLLVGRPWYLVALLPAIGLIQNGPQTQADRHTYVPFVWIFIMIT